jgi:hypothetical protein
MPRVFIAHPVADYDTWRPVYDADKPRRAAAGITDVAVFRDADAALGGLNARTRRRYLPGL